MGGTMGCVHQHGRYNGLRAPTWAVQWVAGTNLHQRVQQRARVRDGRAVDLRRLNVARPVEHVDIKRVGQNVVDKRPELVQVVLRFVVRRFVGSSVGWFDSG